jgi:hypothetical protein
VSPVFVMAGLDPAIHVFVAVRKNVDARDKPGHDGDEAVCAHQSFRNTIDAIHPVISAIATVARP